MSGLVRFTDRGTIRCVDCGLELQPLEALLCTHCDAAEIDELRAMHAPTIPAPPACLVCGAAPAPGLALCGACALPAVDEADTYDSCCSGPACGCGGGVWPELS